MEQRGIVNMTRVMNLLTVVIVIAAVYFFSYQIQKLLSKFAQSMSKRVGTFATNKEFSINRYVYLHRTSIVAKVYNWLNEQLIAAGLKRIGVTPVGYALFWCIVSAVLSIVFKFVFGYSIILGIVTFMILMFIFMVLTRVFVSGQMERREADVMDALDLIIPEVGSGVKNAISRYQDNFAPSLQQDFKIFLSNIQDRGMSFEDSIIILSDSLGIIFKDFAQKAIFFEALGEEDMKGIFDDIVETNRQRRELRYHNNIAFTSLRTSFIISTLMTFGYFGFIMVTDSFSRYFFLKTNIGNALLVAIILIVFSVLSYIATIKSKSI